MIRVRNLRFAYNKRRQVLNGVSLDIARGEVVNILGPNGCGKSTLLEAILGFLKLGPGMITLDDTPLESIRRADLARKLAYVPQLHNGVFHYTALDVVLMGRTMENPWRRFSADDQARARTALGKVRLDRLADRSYLELSGGERQLVLIARALAQNSDFLIMDEPASGLDYGNQFHLLQVIQELSLEGFSIVLTTHHPEQAVFLGGRAILLREGQVWADGPARETITAERVCSLYNLPGETLRRAGVVFAGRTRGEEA